MTHASTQEVVAHQTVGAERTGRRLLPRTAPRPYLDAAPPNTPIELSHLRPGGCGSRVPCTLATARRRLLLALAMGLAFTLPAPAQPPTGNLFGFVIDADRTGIPGVTATLTGSGFPPAVQVTNAGGELLFQGLPPGIYRLRLEREGLATVEYPHIVISAGRNTSLIPRMTTVPDSAISIQGEPPVLLDSRIHSGTALATQVFDDIPDPAPFVPRWAVLHSPTEARLQFFPGDSQTFFELEKPSARTYEPRAIWDHGDAIGWAYESTLGVEQKVHFGSAPKTGVVRQKRYSLEGADLDVATDLRPSKPALYASFTRPGERPGLRHMLALAVVLSSTGSYSLGPAIRVSAGAPDKFNLGPQIAYNPVTDRLWTAFTVCETAQGGCSILRTAVLDPRTFQALPGSVFDLQLPAPWQFWARGTDVTSGPSGANFLAYTALDLDAGQTAVGGWQYSPSGQPTAGVADFFPQVLGNQFGGPDTIYFGSDYWGIVGQNLSGGTYSSYTTTVPLQGSAGPSPAVQVGIDVSPDEPLTTRAAMARWLLKRYATEMTFQVPAGKRQPGLAAATYGPGLYRQTLTITRPCKPDATTLCLGAGRFQVKATHATKAGVGAGTGYLLSNDTGYFTFFDPANVELLVKVIDGCGLGGKHWVFAGGLTDVKVVVTVTDLTNGQMVTILNPQGKAFQPYQNTAAFACGGKTEARPVEPFVTEIAAAEREGSNPALAASASPASVAASTPCKVDSTHLCLAGGRFEVSTVWRTKGGATGAGQAVALPAPSGQPDTGYFWFFAPGNVETVVKVLNACGANQRFWVFAGGLTDVKVTTTVRDTATGVVKTYVNPQGKAFQPVQDTQAFATCS